MVSGLRPVGAGVIGSGVCTYLFLSLAGRVLGPVGFAPVASLWAMVFIVGPGLFLPVQQELGRLVSQYRPARAGRQTLRQVSRVAALLALVAMAVTAVFARVITDRVLGGQWTLLVWFEISIAAYAVSFLARGTLSGLGDYGRFGRLVVSEAAVRLALAAALCLGGMRGAATFGASIALAPLLSTLLVMRGWTGFVLEPGRPVAWSAVVRPIGVLVVGALLAQYVANAGPLFIQVMTPGAQASEAGRFLGALVIARLALYLFQAVQATLLPNLAALLAEGKETEFATDLRRLVRFCAALVVVSTVGAYALGPLVVSIVFGADFAVSAATMATLAAATSVYVLAASLSVAVIAAARHSLSTLAWSAGAAAFTAAAFAGGDLYHRVEFGYLAGSCSAAAVLLVGVRRHRAGVLGHPGGSPTFSRPPEG